MTTVSIAHDHAKPWPMRLILRILIASLAVVALAVGGILFALGASQQRAMASVLQAHQQAVLDFQGRSKTQTGFGTRQMPMAIAPNLGRLLADLKAIDTNGCPPDFQEKYVTVVKAWGQLSVDEKDDAGAAQAIRLLSGVATRNLGPTLDAKKQYDQAQLALQNSWLDLCQCARSHGLTVK